VSDERPAGKGGSPANVQAAAQTSDHPPSSTITDDSKVSIQQPDSPLDFAHDIAWTAAEQKTAFEDGQLPSIAVTSCDWPDDVDSGRRHARSPSEQPFAEDEPEISTFSTGDDEDDNDHHHLQQSASGMLRAPSDGAGHSGHTQHMISPRLLPSPSASPGASRPKNVADPKRKAKAIEELMHTERSVPF